MSVYNPRRKFIKSSSLGLVGLTFIDWQDLPQTSSGTAEMTIREVVKLIVEAIPGGEQDQTVDTFKSGNPDKKCNGIVTTFLATAEVIQKAAEQGANLIITHEPTYYNHLDEVDWLQTDPVYNYKKDLIEKYQMVIWRFHDYWHTVRPDGIFQGLVNKIGWQEYVKSADQIICEIPSTTLGQLGQYFKSTLNLPRPFIVGNPDMKCQKIALLPGAWGGRNQIGMFSSESFDIMVVGEVAEWETSEYIRDATYAGMKKGLIILGHADSEEPGMDYLVNWLKPKFPETPIYHIPAGDAFIPL